MNQWSVKRRRKHFRKCKAIPKGFLCDGCSTNSSMCPWRDKERDARAKKKRETRQAAVDEW